MRALNVCGRECQSIEARVIASLATLLRRNRLHVRPWDAKLLHAEVKRRPLDSQSRSGSAGTGDNPPGVLENLAYVISLRFLQGDCLRGFCFGGRLQVRERWA